MADVSTLRPSFTDPAAEGFSYHTYPFHRLSLASGRYNAAMERALKVIGFDQPTWRVLTILAEDGPRSIGAIADAAVYKPSTLSRIIGRMQAAGLVEVAPRPSDNRVAEVSITPEGRAAYNRTKVVSSRVFQRAAAGFSPAEFENLSHLLAKLAEQFEP
jgi:DNA-binding MarR family transcriptional regulator